MNPLAACPPPRFGGSRPAAGRSLSLFVLALLLGVAVQAPLGAQAAAPLPHETSQPPGACAPDWSALVSGEPGLGDGDTAASVRAMVVWDDGLGDGPVLYAAGHIWSAHGEPVRNIVRWDGSTWSDVGGGVDKRVLALTVFDDGNGEQLYVGGEFDEAGGVPAAHLARWDGTTWSDVEGGTNHTVSALFSMPGGGALVVGGDFTQVGAAVPAERAAIWAPGFWLAFGDGFDDRPLAFAQYQGEIYAGGEFAHSGATPTARLARWTGSTWEEVGGGVGGWVNAWVYTLESVASGPNEGLWVAGSFSEVDQGPAVPIFRVARWDGSTWHDAGFPIGNFTAVYDLASWDDGGGEDLYAVGQLVDNGLGFDNAHVWRRDGSTWNLVGDGVDERCYALAAHDDGSGPALWVGGDLKRAGKRGATGVARWDGATWHATGVGLNDPVLALLGSDLFGGVPTLYLGGAFTAPGQVDEEGIASWSNGSWHSLGGANGLVRALAEYQGAIYAAGEFTEIGGVAASRIARWDGATWSALGSGLNARAFSLQVHDEGAGPRLYVTGDFSAADGLPVGRVAAWDGATWSVVGNGGFIDGSVYDLAFYDDGGGEQLHVSGYFTTVDGVPAASIARFDGAAWHPLGAGLPGSIFPAEARALQVFDGGGGPELYVGGNFTSAGGVAGTGRIARWDGSSWSSVGGGLSGVVQTLSVSADGAGCRLIAGGGFGVSAPTPTYKIAAWTGSAWQALGDGLPNFNDAVYALTVWDQGDGPELIVGGGFTTGVDAATSYVASWGGCWSGVSAWVDLGSGLTGSGFGPPLLIGTGSLALGSSNQLNLLFANPFATAGLFLSFSSTPVPFAGGTLVPFPFLDPIILNVDPVGQILIDYDVVDCLPPGVPIYAQWAIQDGGAPFGIALSNAVVGTTP